MKKLICAAFIATFVSVSAFGWDDVGHKITSYIAWQRMSPAARENVIRILRSAPEDSHLSALYLSSGPESDETKKLTYFMLTSTWADIVRERSFENRYKKYHKGNWHYDDIFWKQVSGKVELLKGFEEGGVAVPKLAEFDKVIRDASASDKEKAIAIAWIMHLTGDLHQPLHTSARVTESEPKGDQGGNLFLISPQGSPRDKQVNIHWYWDSIIGRNIPIKGDTSERHYILPIAQRIMKKHTFAALGGGMKLGDYSGWRDESFALNPTDVFSADLVRFTMPSEKYKRRAFQVAERQLALAGYRLGETLNRVFAAPAATPSR